MTRYKECVRESVNPRQFLALNTKSKKKESSISSDEEDLKHPEMLNLRGWG